MPKLLPFRPTKGAVARHRAAGRNAVFGMDGPRKADRPEGLLAAGAFSHPGRDRP